MKLELSIHAALLCLLSTSVTNFSSVFTRKCYSIVLFCDFNDIKIEELRNRLVSVIAEREQYKRDYERMLQDHTQRIQVVFIGVHSTTAKYTEESNVLLTISFENFAYAVGIDYRYVYKDCAETGIPNASTCLCQKFH